MEYTELPEDMERRSDSREVAEETESELNGSRDILLSESASESGSLESVMSASSGEEAGWRTESCAYMEERVAIIWVEGVYNERRGRVENIRRSRTAQEEGLRRWEGEELERI
jgi:hypothetical protein